MPLDTSFLPSLSPYDVQHAAELIQKAYAPQTAATSPDELKMLQHELFELQKKPEAWGLVLPLLEHQDQNVQFFGAHTAQVKIARDWSTFPQEHATALRDLLVQITAHSMAIGLGKFILRKLCVALTSLALKLVPGQPTRWPDWIMSCVVSFSGRNAPTDQIHEFLAIVAEETDSAELLGPSKLQVRQSLSDATPMVSQAIRQALESGQSIPSALRCLAAWIALLPGDDITPLIPLLISLLNPTSHEQAELFTAASDALQELLSKSSLAAGAGTRVLTEPLLSWLSSTGAPIVDAALAASSGNSNDDSLFDEELSRSLCKLIVALGDHSTTYFANNITSNIRVSPSTPGPGSGFNTPTVPQARGQLIQTFLRIVLAYTSLPGYYGIDEEESELTLGFWYLFQEALWATNFGGEEDEDDDDAEAEWVSGDGGGSWRKVKEKDSGDAQLEMSKAVYIELVKALRRKVAFPGRGNNWPKDQVEKFQVYRRDVGDTLINAYYVLRDDMLRYYLEDVAQRLASSPETTEGAWQEIEATLHCITSIQEALDLEKTPQLARVFSTEIIGRLPSAGSNRLRRTMISLIGAYSSWFATSNEAQNTPDLLMNALNYVVNALPDQALCLQAANALRKLCDANRKALAPQIGAFAHLHAALGNIPDSEKAKVVQSIASVIQALPPIEEIDPIAAIVTPIIQRLGETLQSTSLATDDARALIVHQLETLSGIAKGLTRSTEGVLIFADDDNQESTVKMNEMSQARADPRMETLRQELLTLIRGVIQIWSSDATVGQAISELFKSITSLPNDSTLLTLPPGPLFELVCLAAQRQLTAVWLSLAAILIAQLNPPPPILTPSLAKAGIPAEAEAIVNSALPILLQCSLTTLGQPAAMDNNPDIVQEFFGCMDRVAQDFTRSFYALPQDAQEALITCAVRALALQERYSLVSACGFLSTLIQRSSLYEEMVADKDRILMVHGRAITKAILEGFASIAPRSVVPNLIELMGTLLGRSTRSAREAGGGPGGIMAVDWMKEILSSDTFIASKATAEVKQQFIRAVSNNPKSLKKTREAANQFTLVARGLEGSGFGYASVSM